MVSVGAFDARLDEPSTHASLGVVECESKLLDLLFAAGLFDRYLAIEEVALEGRFDDCSLGFDRCDQAGLHLAHLSSFPVLRLRRSRCASD